ncbi:hypothetical protein QBC35DRAFT_476252 [Podospora australis]|uniref:Uncharacterized protein n=1 Tax=Podospora australis TaxID=1536484 RepID=A0AAN6WPY3_9PEZI|nr:hypothetical protein QBC35DRAFT_476252 [Podospora australis]
MDTHNTGKAAAKPPLRSRTSTWQALSALGTGMTRAHEAPFRRYQDAGSGNVSARAATRDRIKHPIFGKVFPGIQFNPHSKTFQNMRIATAAFENPPQEKGGDVRYHSRYAGSAGSCVVHGATGPSAARLKPMDAFPTGKTSRRLLHGAIACVGNGYAVAMRLGNLLEIPSEAVTAAQLRSASRKLGDRLRRCGLPGPLNVWERRVHGIDASTLLVAEYDGRSCCGLEEAHLQTPSMADKTSFRMVMMMPTSA